MAFDTYNAATSETSAKPKPKVDFDALNQYVVKEAGLQNPETLRGVISVLVDLGTQKQNDAQYNVDKGDEALSIEQLTAKYAEDIKEGKITKFAEAWDNDIKAKVIQKFVPQKDFQSVIFAVDFPNIMLNKGTFFGDEKAEPKPLRLWMGGQYWHKGKELMLVQNVIPLKVTKDDKITGWTMNPRSTFYKMALGAKLIQQDEAFVPANIDALVGKTLQFKAQVFFKKGKDGKDYYTEKLTFAAGLARDQAELTLDKTYVIQFKKENDPQALQELRGHVLNTIKNAVNYNGSAIQKQLKELGLDKDATPVQEATPEAPKDAPVAPADLDDTIPF